MMGERQVHQDALFYEFSLERHVPETHLLRSIDPFVDLSRIREHLRPCREILLLPGDNDVTSHLARLNSSETKSVAASAEIND
jgi:hypothetical protein